MRPTFLPLQLQLRLQFRSALASCVALVSFVCAAPRVVYAQPPDGIGVRAQGMSGAFTAVADDSTSTWWNPSGLATGAYLSAIVEYGRSRDSDAKVPEHRGISLAFPALGLSYYRLTVSEIQPSTSTGNTPPGRQDPGTLDVRPIEISQFGATAGQSIGRHLVIGSTLKLVRALGESKGGLDIGAMAAVGLVRAGVMVRNVRELTFSSGNVAMTLKRHVRAGFALTTTARSGFGGATLSADADLRAVPTLFGNERRIAGGGEIWTRTRSLGGRAGISASTIGDARMAASAGLSLALRSSVYVDGQFTGGSDITRRGWGAALRVTF